MCIGASGYHQDLSIYMQVSKENYHIIQCGEKVKITDQQHIYLKLYYLMPAFLVLT